MSMPTCPSCIYAQGICEKTGVKIRNSTGCTYHKPKPMTNYDRLISKTPNEMALWFAKTFGDVEDYRMWMRWLSTPISEEGEK